jgi:hypothetical protein
VPGAGSLAVVVHAYTLTDTVTVMPTVILARAGGTQKRLICLPTLPNLGVLEQEVREQGSLLP